MNNLINISRDFVEFGPFKSHEIADFKQRGIIADSDYLRVHGTDRWVPANIWMSALPDRAANAKPKKAKTPIKKKASAKKVV